jgi:hypothetical protein
LAAGPVRHGDPVWLQVCEGRGDDGWQSGSVVAPYVQRAIHLDQSAVDIEGHPSGWSRMQQLAESDAEGELRLRARTPIGRPAGTLPHEPRWRSPHHSPRSHSCS